MVALASIVLLSGCDKFLKIVSVRTLDFSNVTATTAVLKGQVVSDGGGAITERGFFYSTSKSLRDAQEVACGAGGKGDFECTIKNLQPNTTYYYQAYAKGDNDLDVGDVLEFTTYELNLTVETLQPEIFSADSIILKGKFVNREDLQIVRVGFEYSKNGDYSGSTVVCADIADEFSAVVCLLPNTNYYYRAFVDTEDATIVVVGESVVFSTGEETAPEVTTLEADQITATSAHMNASISTSFTGDINSKGFYWSTSADFVSKETLWSGAGMGNGSFTGYLENLNPATTYYYKAFVTYQSTDSQVEVLGEVKSFTTLEE